MTAAPAVAASVDLPAQGKFRASGDCGPVVPSYVNFRSQIAFNLNGVVGTEHDSWTFTSTTGTAPTSACVVIYYPKCYNLAPTAYTQQGFSTSLTALPDATLNGITYYAYQICQTTPATGWVWNSTTGVFSQTSTLVNFAVNISLRTATSTCRPPIPTTSWTTCPCNDGNQASPGLDLFVKRTVVQGGDSYVSWGSVPYAPCPATHF